MIRDENRYYPPGYCGTYYLLERAYYHLYPEPLSDPELIEAALRYLSFEEDLDRCIRNLDAVGLSRKQEQKIRRRIGELTTEIALCRFVERAIADRIFDPILSLFPPFPEFEFLHFPSDGKLYTDGRSATKPDWPEHQGPPHHIIEIGFARFRQVTNLLRDKLFAGQLTPFLSSALTGVFEYRDEAFWLDVKNSNSCFLSGRIAATGTDLELDVMFETDRVEGLLPVLGAELVQSEKSPTNRKYKLEPTIEALRRLHPEGRPDATVNELQRQVQSETGVLVGKTTMDKAIAKAWPGKD